MRLRRVVVQRKQIDGFVAAENLQPQRGRGVVRVHVRPRVAVLGLLAVRVEPLNEDVDELSKLGFITDKENIPGINSWDDDYSFDGANGYVTFIFDVIVKRYIPDFEWDIYEIPNEKTLDCLDGNGYGLFCL